MTRTREVKWHDIPVEAGPDAMFDIVEDSSIPKIRLVLIPHGYVPFPEDILTDLLDEVLTKWGITPERFLVTSGGIYAVIAKAKSEVRDVR